MPTYEHPHGIIEDVELGAVFAVILRIERKVDQLMAQVQIDDAVLQSLATSLQTIDSEVGSLVAAANLPQDNASVQAIQSAVSDITSQLSAAGVTAPASGTGTPTDGGTGTPTDGGTGTTTPTDPTAPTS